MVRVVWKLPLAAYVEVEPMTLRETLLLDGGIDVKLCKVTISREKKEQSENTKGRGLYRGRRQRRRARI